MRHCASFRFRSRVNWKRVSGLSAKDRSDFGKTEFERPTPIKLYGWKNHRKFNITQSAIRRIVGGHKALFPFEGATCQELTQKKEGCGMEQGDTKGKPQPSEGEELITTM